MKKFIAGMLFAHYLRVTGVSPFLRLVFRNIVKRVLEDTRPESESPISEQRVTEAAKRTRDWFAMEEMIVGEHSKGESFSEIARKTGLTESTVRIIVENYVPQKETNAG